MGKGRTLSDYEGLSWSETGFLFLKRWAAAGIAMSTAEVFTLPLDTAKVRMQIQGTITGTAKPYTSMANCISRMVTEEGATSLWKGLAPGLLRQMIYGGLRLGMYDYVRDWYKDRLDEPGEKASFSVKLLSGITTGAIAMCAGQPTDVVKIRFQASGASGAAARYNSMWGAFLAIMKQDGARGLWRGLIPNISRNAIINTAELATYDQIKEIFLEKKWMEDSVPLHVVAAVGAAFCAVVVGSPFDVVKTRIMNGAVNAEGKLLYTGMLSTFWKVGTQEGPLAFYKGFLPCFYRLAAWVTVMFLTYEQIKIHAWPYLNKDGFEELL